MGNIIGASLNTVTTAYTPLLVNVDEAFICFQYSPCGTDYGATSIGAVHTCPAGEEPSKLTITLGFYEAHLDPGFGGKFFGILIGASIFCFFSFMLIPTLAGYLASSTGGTFGTVV
jgi:hypothetical protein